MIQGFAEPSGGQVMTEPFALDALAARLRESSAGQAVSLPGGR